MGLFSSSKSKTAVTTTTIDETVNKAIADYSQLDEGASQSKQIIDISKSKNVDLTMLDGGAIQGAFDFGKDLTAKVFDVQSQTLEDAARAQQAGYNMAGDVVAALRESKRGEVENVFLESGKWLALVAVAISALIIFKRRSK